MIRIQDVFDDSDGLGILAMILLLIISFVGLVVVGIIIYKTVRYECAESHQGVVHVPGRWQTTIIGKVTSGYWVAGYDYNGTICDKYKERF